MNPNDLRLPPHSIEAEHAVLGGILLNGAIAMDRIEGVLNEAEFYIDAHRRIFGAAKGLYDVGKVIDAITVSEALQARGDDEATGGLTYLGTITNNTIGGANVRRHAEIVREKAILRGLCEIGNEIQTACATPSMQGPEEIAAQAEAAMLRLLDHQDGEPVRLYDALGETLSKIDKRIELGGRHAGLLTGFAGLDNLTGGLEPGQLTIIAARPSVGKSAIACNITDYVAGNGTAVLFHTLEMSRSDVAMRILAARTKVSMSAMRSGTEDVEHWQRMSETAGKTEKMPLFIDDRGAVTVGYVRAKARRLKRVHGLGLIVVDYLQLMRGIGDNRTQEVGSLSRGLKALAKELQVPIIALAQLNRGVETRTDKRPVLADLRDSGEIEQDADIVLMLHREDQHNKTQDWAGLAELIVRKNRNGPLGELLLSYDAPLMLFTQHRGQSPRRTSAEVVHSAGFSG